METFKMEKWWLKYKLCSWIITYLITFLLQVYEKIVIFWEIWRNYRIICYKDEMATEKPKIFFSYARADADFVLKLAKELRSAGENLWLDQLDIPAGERWDRSVEEALQACDRLLVILSPTSVDSHNVMDEVSYALEEGKQVLPVLHRDCKIPFRLRRVQYIDLTRDYDSGFDRLLNALKVDPSVGRPEQAETQKQTTPDLKKPPDETQLDPEAQAKDVPVRPRASRKRGLWSRGAITIGLLLALPIGAILAIYAFPGLREAIFPGRVSTGDVNSTQVDTLYSSLINGSDFLFSQGKYHEAKRKYEQALAQKPGDTYATGKIEECEQRISAIADTERLYSKYKREGNTLFDQGKYPEAKRKYEAALRQKPGDTYATKKIDQVVQLVFRAASLPYNLRKTPKRLSQKDKVQMVVQYRFFEKYDNKNGQGIRNEFEIQKNGKVIYDAATGLTWQQSGSSKFTFENVQAYIEQLKRDNYAGYSD